MLRFVLLQVINPHYHQAEALRNMAEMEQLVATYGGEIVIKSIQHRIKPDQNTYLGEGKVVWLLEFVKAHKIDVVVINAIVKSSQLFRLEQALWAVNTQIKVWDRVDIILNIFDQHATTTEAKLQIELARIQHIGPRIYGLGKTRLSRQGGGIGTRGIGETNIEIERRTIKKVRQNILKQLKQRAAVQDSRRQQRQQLGMKTVALVGYTSAGKTTLFNALTSKRKQTKTDLFTTLDTVVGKVKLQKYAPTILISDTIGFIDDLPPFLIDAFRSTLQEAIDAELLLHVIDAADPAMTEKIAVVNQILIDLKVKSQPIKVFNKIDLLPSAQQKILKHEYAGETAFYISALIGEGLSDLKELINSSLLTKT